MTNQGVDLLTINSGDAEQPFNYTVGAEGSKFLNEIRDNKRFMGIKCPKCGKVYIPPRKVCGTCFVEMTEWVPVKDEGYLHTFTILRFAFLDPETGKEKPVPYGYAFIRLDGADTDLQHYVEIKDEKKVKIGARVKAVFEENRAGKITDVKHFAVID